MECSDFPVCIFHRALIRRDVNCLQQLMQLEIVFFYLLLY